MSLEARPIELRDANRFVEEHHRHARPVRGGKFAVAAITEDGLQGVAVVGRPVARMLQDGVTAEVTRCCVIEDAPKGTCSFLYACCWRAWRGMGGKKLITYTLKSESGASLRGAGFKVVGETKARSKEHAWRSHDRHRDWHPSYGQEKLRWEQGDHERR